jgi:hypothetical protein
MQDYEADAVTARALVNHKGTSIKVDEDTGNHVVTITDPNLNKALAVYIYRLLLSHALGCTHVK